METKANIFSFILKLVIRSTLKVQLSIFGIEVEEISYCIQLKLFRKSGGQFHNLELE